MKIPILFSVNNIILCYIVAFPIILHKKPMRYSHSENIACVMDLRKRGNILVPFVLHSDQYRQQ